MKLIGKKLIALSLVAAFPGIASAAGSIQGTIKNVFAGNDNWYGVRFYMNISSDQTNGECNSAFVYTEPEPDSGHKNKVAIFMAAYLAGKPVEFTVAAGRNGYCKLIEGTTR